MIIKNDNNIMVPEYLNEEFFVNTLEEGLREVKVTIHEINFAWGSNPGDNYCSSIYRVLVDYDTSCGHDDPQERQQISLIVKTIPITPETQFLEDVGVFVKEKLTYFDVLPRLSILSNGDQFGAKYLKFNLKRKKMEILMGNLFLFLVAFMPPNHQCKLLFLMILKLMVLQWLHAKMVWIGIIRL